MLRLGFKGLALLEIRVEGGDWGGPARGDVHALHGALLASPAWELVRALATLADSRGVLAVDGLDAILPHPPAPIARWCARPPSASIRGITQEVSA